MFKQNFTYINSELSSVHFQKSFVIILPEYHAQPRAAATINSIGTLESELNSRHDPSFESTQTHYREAGDIISSVSGHRKK